MTFIYGVVCETCNTVDAVPRKDAFSEDDLPRNGWISVSFWQGEEKGEPDGPEYHLCSPKCLMEFAKNTTQTTTPSEKSEEHNHPHPH